VDESELQDVQEELQSDPLLEEEVVEVEQSEFLDIAIYLFDGPDLAGAYVGVFGACLIAYMLFTVILRSVGGDE